MGAARRITMVIPTDSVDLKPALTVSDAKDPANSFAPIVVSFLHPGPACDFYEELNTTIVNSGTFAGAECFLVDVYRLLPPANGAPSGNRTRARRVIVDRPHERPGIGRAI